MLPMIGRGSLQNLRDIMFLRGVDIGIVQMDAREQLKRREPPGRCGAAPALHHAPLQRGGPHHRQPGDHGYPAARRQEGQYRQVRQRHEPDLAPDLRQARDQARGDDLRSGLVLCQAEVGRDPGRRLRGRTAGSRHRRVPDRGPLPSSRRFPFEGEIAESYFPASFANADYPQLVDKDKPVETLAVGSLLAVFNWPENSDRYNRVQRFVDAFFSRFDEFLQPGRHPKWKEVNLAADVPGWERVRPAQDWLDRAATASKPSAQSSELRELHEQQRGSTSRRSSERFCSGNSSHGRATGRERPGA